MRGEKGLAVHGMLMSDPAGQGERLGDIAEPGRVMVRSSVLYSLYSLLLDIFLYVI